MKHYDDAGDWIENRMNQNPFQYEWHSSATTTPRLTKKWITCLVTKSIHLVFKFSLLFTNIHFASLSIGLLVFKKILPSSLSCYNFTKLHNPPPSAGSPAPPHLVHVATLSVLDLRHHNSGLANVVIFTVFVWCLLHWSCTSHICGSFENCRPYHLVRHDPS